ncbi:hypothetical protein ACE1TF_13485 [Geomicrobium sp. JSM 1781026]|uniref:hypothetical protein n=1 Tax=unclassified Geomicrobium TaxID=2628951 RepID=UPI0005A7A54E|nr:hypothetical protein [Geomicrobium sp. JCM 19037]
MLGAILRASLRFSPTLELISQDSCVDSRMKCQRHVGPTGPKPNLTRFGASRADVLWVAEHSLHLPSLPLLFEEILSFNILWINYKKHHSTNNAKNRGKCRFLRLEASGSGINLTKKFENNIYNKNG